MLVEGVDNSGTTQGCWAGVAMPVTGYLLVDVTGTSIEVSKMLVEGINTIGTTWGYLVGTSIEASKWC